jgi:hypothetical protein
MVARCHSDSLAPVGLRRASSQRRGCHPLSRCRFGPRGVPRKGKREGNRFRSRLEVARQISTCDLGSYETGGRGHALTSRPGEVSSLRRSGKAGSSPVAPVFRTSCYLGRLAGSAKPCSAVPWPIRGPNVSAAATDRETTKARAPDDPPPALTLTRSDREPQQAPGADCPFALAVRGETMRPRLVRFCCVKRLGRIPPCSAGADCGDSFPGQELMRSSSQRRRNLSVRETDFTAAGVGCINSATRSDEAYLQRNRVCAPRRAVPRWGAKIRCALREIRGLWVGR